MEFLPRTGRPATVTASLLGAVTGAYGDASLLVTVGRSLDSDLLGSFGFHSERNPVLRWAFRGRPFVVRPISGTNLEWRIHGTDLRKPENWLLGFGDIDVN
jgi:hypothetical protein